MVKRFRTGNQTLAREFIRSFILTEHWTRSWPRAYLLVFTQLIKTTALVRSVLLQEVFAQSRAT